MKVPKNRRRKKGKEDKQTLAELNSPHRQSQANANVTFSCFSVCHKRQHLINQA